MATITITTTPHPNARRRLRNAAVTLWATLTTLATRAATPHKAALANLAHMPLTVAGLGCADYAAWHIAAGWGWAAIAASLILLEHLIADEQ